MVVVDAAPRAMKFASVESQPRETKRPGSIVERAKIACRFEVGKTWRLTPTVI